MSLGLRGCLRGCLSRCAVREGGMVYPPLTINGTQLQLRLPAISLLLAVQQHILP
jgi:hypothetical protein